MSKIEVKICMGTMCYVMGGAELKSIAATLPKEIKEAVNITYSPCLGTCNNAGEPPYIEVNGRVISRVSKANFLQILKDEIKNVIR